MTTLHVRHVFINFFAFIAQPQRETMPNFTFCTGRERNTTTFQFFFQNYKSLLEVDQQTHQHLIN